MTFSFVRPTPTRIASFRAQQAALPFSYTTLQSTRGQAPAGMKRDRNSIPLGVGDEAWSRACNSIRSWRMFDLGWVELHDTNTPIQVGTTVAVLARSLGLWSLNAARIVYVIDEPARFGFAYGTLPDHAESGEELFLVTRDRAGAISYEITADSRPNQLAAKLAYPWVRTLQKRFARCSLEAMQRAM